MTTIVIKPDFGVDLARGSGPRLHKLTRIKPGKLKKIFDILISYMKKLRNNPCEYNIYML
jgi:hypothetical protein